MITFNILKSHGKLSDAPDTVIQSQESMLADRFVLIDDVCVFMFICVNVSYFVCVVYVM